jgi:hypothetical protein
MTDVSTEIRTENFLNPYLELYCNVDVLDLIRNRTWNTFSFSPAFRNETSTVLTVFSFVPACSGSVRPLPPSAKSLLVHHSSIVIIFEHCNLTESFVK